MKQKVTIDITERSQKYSRVVENQINNTIIEKPSAASFLEKLMTFIRK
jgi:hypothetical protein